MISNILDYLGYLTIALMVVLGVLNLLVIADKMTHRSGFVERAVKRASFYIRILRFGGGGSRGRHHEG
jgi:hypothetical protein